jgi:hypothetical protein
MLFTYSYSKSGRDRFETSQLSFRFNPATWFTASLGIPYIHREGYSSLALTSFEETGVGDVSASAFLNLTEALWPTMKVYI